MSELLAPAGDFESLIAAISHGADAIYLGMSQFGARAYAKNFDEEQLKEAIKYAHLREVKIYVTMNTILFEKELSMAYQQVDNLYLLNVDGIIVADLALVNYISRNYPKMEVHCSTQMGIEDLEGIRFFEKLGANRVVLAREVPISKIKDIKEATTMPLEVFVHGALCVAYSGNCLMSGLIGYRSGNRGRCVGSCRKPYTLINTTKNIKYPQNYLLSMKDLATSHCINDLKLIDSLKIEGRMKEPVYVANIVNTYRQLLDNQGLNPKNFDKNLTKTFNRTFTKGYIFNEDKKNITNLAKPNNYGFEIGKITNKYKNKYQVTLIDTLSQGDQIRIDSQEEVNLPVLKIYDKENKLINSATNICYIEVTEKLNIGDIVYKTKDIKYIGELEKSYPKEFRRFPLNIYLNGKANNPLTITINCEEIYKTFTSSLILDKAINNPTTFDTFQKQFSRLNDTVYFLNHLELNIADDIFIPINQINELRRTSVEVINNARLPQRTPIKITEEIIKPISTLSTDVKLSAYCSTLEQYQTSLEMGIEIIYYKDNVVRRNHVDYPKKEGLVLAGGYGGIEAYKNNELVSDFSLNVVNSETVYLLHSLGVKRVTLSYEINKKQINDLIEAYYKKNNGYPNLEMIVYGRADLLFTEYCPLKAMNLCSTCKTDKYYLEDEYSYFPIISHDDCTTTILNGKILNLIDDLENIKNISVYRLQFTTENSTETKKTINSFRDKLKSMQKTKLFNEQTDTRGHFNKEIL